MEPALVSQDGSWHQNMLRKWLDKNNRIRPGVFEEVCWRLIKDSDLCSLHQKKQILCFLKNGTLELGCDVQYTQQRAQNKYGGVNKRQEMKNTAPMWQLHVLHWISEINSNLVNLSLFSLSLNMDSSSLSEVHKHDLKSDCLCRYCSWFAYYSKELSNQVGNSHQRCFVELCSRPLTAVE